MMDLINPLSVVFLIIFLVLAIVLIVALRAPKEEYDPDFHTLLPQSRRTSRPWRNKLGRILVMRPWPYKDLYNPLNRLYWPEEEMNKRVQRRRVRRKSKR
jgi:hypothetical protein